MTCSEARRRILEADTAELEGTSESPLARHLRECARCQSMAAKVLRGERATRAAWLREAPRRSADTVANAVLHGTAERLLTAEAEPAWRGASRRVAGALVLGGFAAAVMIGIGVAETRHAATSVMVPPAQTEPGVTGLDVEVPVGRNAVVFNTRDTLITVVWIY